MPEPAFPPNDCDDIEVDAIEWPPIDELVDCVVAEAPPMIHDCRPPPFPLPLPSSLSPSDSSSVSG